MTYLQETQDLSTCLCPGPALRLPLPSSSMGWGSTPSSEPLFRDSHSHSVQKSNKSQHIGQFGRYPFKECPWSSHVLKHFQVEKAMATHSSTLTWKLPWTEEAGRLQSMGSWRVGPDWATSLSLFTFMHWRRKWQPTPVFLPGESQGRGAWWPAIYGCKESDTTEAT